MSDLLHDFDWFLDRLEVARWVSEEPGSRDVLANCPVHGGSDSLHVTEKNGKALVNCFAQKCAYDAILEALESGPEAEDSEPEEEAKPVRRRRRVTIGRGREEQTQSESRDDEESGTGTPGTRGSTPRRLHQDPRQWLIDRCNLDPDLFDQAVPGLLPLSFTSDAVVFEFDNGSRKIRGVGEGKKGKKYSWSGHDAAPPLWPMPPDDPGEEIVVCEGEMDAIVLRLSGYQAFSVTKGANAEVPQVIWDALRARGVERVRLAYDLDDAGRKGRALAAQGAHESGIIAIPSRPVGIEVLAGETDARDVALRNGLPVELEDDSDEDDSWLLSDVPRAKHEPLLLDRLHPHEHTILFGHGGTGKGVIAAWWIARLTRTPYDRRVLIVDYEQHAQHEWRPRIERFGGDMDRVRIVQPTRPIWDIAGYLRTQVNVHDIDYVVVDSVTYACVGEDVNDSTTAVKYSMAIATLQAPVLSLAHVTKENKNPDDPFGSAFWSNGARVTIAVSRGEEPASNRVIRNPKTNQRGNFKTVAVKWDWLGNVEVGHEPGHCTNRANDGYVHLDEVAAYTVKRQAITGFYEDHGYWPKDGDDMLDYWDDDEKPVTDSDIKQARFQYDKKNPKPPRVNRRKRGDEDADD